MQNSLKQHINIFITGAVLLERCAVNRLRITMLQHFHNDVNNEQFHNDAPAQLTIFTLLVKVSATVTDYRGHHQTLFILPCSSCASELFEIVLWWRANIPGPSIEPRHAPLPECVDHWAGLLQNYKYQTLLKSARF